MVLGTPGHSWQEVTQSSMSIGHKGMILAAKVLALAALDFIEKPELIFKAKEELEKRLGSSKYESPIAPNIKPNVPEWIFDAME